MKFCLMSEANPSTAIHLLYYSQSQGIKISDVILIGDTEEDYTFFYKYSEVNNFNLYLINNLNSKECVSILEKIKPDILLIMIQTILRDNILQMRLQ